MKYLLITLTVLFFFFTQLAFATPENNPRGLALADLAEQLGYPVASLLPEKDLIADLHLDRTTVIDAVISLCEDYHVEPPEEDLTNVGSIIDWLLEKAPPVSLMRGFKKDQPVVVQRVYFATNRHQTKSTDPAEMFDGKRCPPGRASFGYADVSIPPGHKEGQIESPLLNIKALHDPGRHFMIRQLNTLAEETFFKQVSLLLANNEQLQDGIVVFIHGFNTTFKNVLLRTAQLAHDSEFMGIPIAFTWPSDGKMLAYTSDREDVTWSIQYIEDFIRSLRQKMPNRKIHLIAHSMGSQGLVGALYHMALKNDPATRFDSVILAAPDFDAAYFGEQIAPRVRHLANRWAIYASDKDATLDFSSTLNAMKRLGQPVTPVEGMQVVDATGLEVTPWNVPQSHSYYATKKRLIDDMMGFFRGYLPKQRNLSVHVLEEGTRYWSLSE